MGRFVFLLVFVIFETSSCYGQNVNLRNGNFYVSYTDIDLKNTTSIIYDQDGKIENIDGDQQMAVKIFQTFQNLIGYLEPADARYNF
ncbi:hypothetical protein AAU57_08430 [Nonlabens sp. YIK11]|nr:hypothetical protein AAU57_08430 [Nonlabens sp. YIK11]